MAPMEEVYDLSKLWLAADKDAFLAEAGARVRAIATTGVLGASTALIDRCPNLEIIACYGVGFDAIDWACAQERGVRVTTTPDVLTEDVADFAFALILAQLRGSWRETPTCVRAPGREPAPCSSERACVARPSAFSASVALAV